MNNEEMENHNLITAFKKMWSNMFYIAGKTERADFWLGYVTASIIALLFFTIVLGTNGNIFAIILFSIVGAFHLIMTFTAAIRRLHDANFSGHFLWLLLIPIFGVVIVFVLLITPTSDENRHAPSTKPAGVKWESNILNWIIIIVTALALFGINELILNADNSYNNKIDVTNTSNNDDSSSSDSSSSSQSSSSSSEPSESSSSEQSSSSEESSDKSESSNDDEDNQKDQDSDKDKDNQDQEDKDSASEQSSSSEDSNKENSDDNDDQDKSSDQSNNDDDKQQSDDQKQDSQNNDQAKTNDDQNKQQSQNESSDQQKADDNNAASSSSDK
ncbi:DUF805 domain-containing protein [Apilactobacillus quenuiae]|uniref:DUF805 domain-containing protein n=1 Tax=Apilactobacillus quenuiae TaxID=2008377 RepID=UPI000D01AB45|nr:DUF805 domain-containing protein [Apilactobacillus quenuiae]